MTEDEWLDERESWWSRHFIRAGADGSVLPDLGLVRDDEHLVLDWAPWSDRELLPLIPAGSHSVPWEEGRETLRAFVAQVAEWMREAENRAYEWPYAQDPFVAAEPTLGVALEFLTGRPVTRLLDLYGAATADELAEALQLLGRGQDPAVSPQCQVLRDLAPDSESRDVVETLKEMGSRVREQADGQRWIAARALANDASRGAVAPEQAGQLAATELRRELGLNGGPVGKIDVLLASFGVHHDHADVTSPVDRMFVAAELAGSATVATLNSPRTERSWARRFEAARGLGHLLLDPTRSGALGAASGPYAQETRRKRSGAFAAEFLLPESAMSQLSNGELDGAAKDETFASVLERFGVGAQTAAHQLWNRGWLSGPEVRDELIARYAYV